MKGEWCSGLINKVIQNYRYIGWQASQCIAFRQVGHSTTTIGSLDVVDLPVFLTLSRQVEQNIWPQRVVIRFRLDAFISEKVSMQIGQVGSSTTGEGAGGGVSTRATGFSTTFALVVSFLFCFRPVDGWLKPIWTGNDRWSDRKGTRISGTRTLSPTKITDWSAVELSECLEGGSNRRLSPVETYSSVNESSVRSIIEVSAMSP